MKKLIILAALVVSAFVAQAQPQMESKEMVSLRPLMPTEVKGLPEVARTALNNKLNQMVTQNGFGATSGQFVLTANVVTVDKQTTATAPPQFMIKYDVSFYVVDVLEGTMLDEVTVSVTGVDRLENRAIVQAINQISPRSTSIRTFMNNSRTKIVDYYNTRIPSLLTKAQGMADRNDYAGALYILSMIPDTVDQYPMVSEQMTAIYEKKIEREADQLLQVARAKAAAKEYDTALEALMAVDPSSSKSGEAMKLIESLSEKMDEEERRYYEDWKMLTLKAHESATALEMMRISAARDVGVEQAKAEAAKAENPVQKGLDAWFVINIY